MNSLRVPDLGSIIEASSFVILSEIAIERAMRSFTCTSAALDEVGGEVEARSVFLAHFPARAIARLAVGARGALGALKFGLFRETCAS